MEVKRIRASGALRTELMERLTLGDGLGLRQAADGLPQLASGAWVEVRAEGLAVDGATDETAEMDQVLDYVQGLGGGVVFHRHGTLYLSTMALRSNVIVTGGGSGSIFKQVDDSFTQVDSGTSSGSNTTTVFKDTSKTWGDPTGDPFLPLFLEYTLEITSGPLSGEIRAITWHDDTELTLEKPFASVPGSVTYRILQPKHIVTLDTASEEFCGLVRCQLDGNKANQTSYNDGIHLVNTGGGPTMFDVRHIVSDVLVFEPSGCGFTISKSVRQCCFFNVWTHLAGRYGKHTFHTGGTDNFFVGCTFAGSGLSGVRAGGTNEHYTACKAFGNGKDEVAGNGAGFLITQPGMFTDCEAQENFDRGFHVFDTVMVGLSNIKSDANGGEAVCIDGSLDCGVTGLVSSGVGLLYETEWALSLINGSDRNHINLVVRAAEMSGGLIDPASGAMAENVVFVNSRIYGRLYMSGKVGINEEHLNFSHDGAPASGLPYYVFKTTSDAVTKIQVQGYDGTDTKQFFTLDYENSRFDVGGPGTTVNIADVSGAVASIVGTLGGTADEHFRFGKTGAPDAGNPYWFLKTSAASPPKAELASWDGTTARTYQVLDHANWIQDLWKAKLYNAAGVLVFDGTQTQQTKPILDSYTPDGESGAYTGTAIGVGSDYTDTPAALGDAATLADLNDLRASTVATVAALAELNALRVAYENLRAAHDDLRAKFGDLADALENYELVA